MAKMKLKLVERKKEIVPHVETFYFQPDTPFNWKPGQFLRYNLPHENPDDRGPNRFFTIACAPFEGHIQLTTRFTPKTGSSFKKALQSLKIGDEIEAFGPMGDFSADQENNKFVFIAGGMGITPFRAVLTDFTQSGKPFNVTLLYANRTHEAVFKEELEEIAISHPDFKIFYILSDETVSNQKIAENINILPGRVDEEVIKKLVPDYVKAIYYISGPEEMVMDLEQKVWGMGIPKDHTNQDYFPGYENY